MGNNTFLFILIIGAVIFLYFYIKKNFSFPVFSHLNFFDGGVKTGKSTIMFASAFKQFKRNMRGYKIACFFCKIFKFFRKDKPLPEQPELYSNIPLAVPYTPINQDLLLGKVRAPYNSVLIIDEISLLADSQLIKDKDVNVDLLLFFKLCGHKHLQIFTNSQTLFDCHYSLKRSISDYYYVEKTVKWIPFFIIAYMRKERFSEDSTIVNNYDDDVSQTMRKVLVLKKVWKYFDSFTFSGISDDLPTYRDTRISTNLKVKNIVSFNPDIIKRFMFLKNGGSIDEQKEA